MLYKEKYSLSHRISESNRILSKHPLHIPVVVDVDKSIGKINKNKFLVPRDVSTSHLMISIRKQVSVESNKALFMFCNNAIICPTSIIGDLYEQYLDNKPEDEKGDKFLYVYVATENTFG